MANTKSSKKDLRRIAKRTVTNKAVRSSLKTFVKKARTSIATGDPNATGSAVIDVVSALDKAAQNGVIHKKQAARRKSRIAKAANAVLKGGAVAAPAKEPKEAKKAAPAPKKAATAKPAAEKKPAAAKKPAAGAEKKPAAKKAKAE